MRVGELDKAPMHSMGSTRNAQPRGPTKTTARVDEPTLRHTNRSAARGTHALALALLATCLATTASRAQEPTPDEVTPALAESVLYQRYQAFLAQSANQRSIGVSDTLGDYAAKCDAAIGLTVRGFSCEDGVEVPGQGTVPDGSLCDRPNVLHGKCDPGSKFQVLARNADAAVVAHCRKVGLSTNDADNGRDRGMYSDIAVIQYNKSNGAICFYQALGRLDGRNVPPPSAGESAWHWIGPKGTQNIGCTGCHDNGGFIRSPYLAQLNLLPSTAEGFDNLHTPLRYVGLDYATDRSWSVDAPAPACPSGENCLRCNSCHRLAVNNNRDGKGGTAIDFAMKATARTQLSKTMHSAASPIWMRPGQVDYSAQAEADATAFRDCGNAFVSGGPSNLPAGCSVQPLGVPYDRLPSGPSGTGSNLNPGEMLAPGESIASSNGRYTLVYQQDGNLVLRAADNAALWASNTAGKPNGVCLMQADGNLVCYAPEGTAAWDTGTSGNPNSRLSVQDDGNVVIYRPDGAAIWATHTNRSPVPSTADHIDAGQYMERGGSIVSPSGQFSLLYQSDGNLVLYRDSGVALWAANTSGTDAGSCTMQADGNLVLTTPSGAPIWASSTAGNPGSRLVVQDDGNLVIYRSDSVPIWATNTNIPKGTPGTGDVLNPGEGLTPDEYIMSSNGQFMFVFQRNGNLFLYRADGKQLWSSGAPGRTAGSSIMQEDGNLVIYLPGGTPAWSTNTWGNPGSRLVVQDDGNVVIYRPDGVPIWATQTSQ
jgi:hypothetical protein